MTDNLPPANTRLGWPWRASEIRGIPLRTILVTAGVLVAVFLAGKLIYRLRDVILLMLVAGFIALILNPLVVALQRWRIQRRGWAVTVVTLWGLLVFAGGPFVSACARPRRPGHRGRRPVAKISGREDQPLRRMA